MKITRKLIPALAMLVVAAVVMSSATFAWFTMSRQVTATGMNVTVTAPDNLLISGDSDGGVFGSVGTAASSPVLKVYPASSIDGTTFFKVADGQAVANTGELNTETVLSDAVSASTNGTPGGYVDFLYQLKTLGTTPINVAVKSLTVTRNGSTGSDDGLKAVRAAVLIQGSPAAPYAGVTNVVLVPAGANNWTDDEAITNVDHSTDAVKAATIGATTTDGSDKVLTVAANGVVSNVIVRVWIEGEDEKCDIADAASLDFNVEIVFRDATYVAA